MIAVPFNDLPPFAQIIAGGSGIGFLDSPAGGLSPGEIPKFIGPVVKAGLKHLLVEPGSIKAGCFGQFYITLDPTPFLDGQYTVFGQTVSGQDVVEKIEVGDTIESIEVKEQ